MEPGNVAGGVKGFSVSLPNSIKTYINLLVSEDISLPVQNLHIFSLCTTQSLIRHYFYATNLNYLSKMSVFSLPPATAYFDMYPLW